MVILSYQCHKIVMLRFVVLDDLLGKTSYCWSSRFTSSRGCLGISRASCSGGLRFGVLSAKAAMGRKSAPAQEGSMKV